MLVVPTQPDRVNGSTTAPAAAVNATATQHSLSGVMLHEARRQLGGRARRGELASRVDCYPVVDP
jgi:hypothetical protein